MVAFCYPKIQSLLPFLMRELVFRLGRRTQIPTKSKVTLGKCVMQQVRLLNETIRRYSADPITKQLIPFAPACEQIKAFYQWAADGVLPSDIAARANERGWHKQQEKATCQGVRFTATLLEADVMKAIKLLSESNAELAKHWNKLDLRQQRLLVPRIVESVSIDAVRETITVKLKSDALECLD